MKITSALSLIAGIHSTTNYKRSNEQIIIFYSPSNAICSSDESADFKHNTGATNSGLGGGRGRFKSEPFLYRKYKWCIKESNASLFHRVNTIEHNMYLSWHAGSLSITSKNDASSVIAKFQ